MDKGSATASDVVQFPKSSMTKVVDGEVVRLIEERDLVQSDEPLVLVPFDGKRCPNCGWEVLFDAATSAPRDLENEKETK